MPDTIAAISTGNVMSALGVIRLSGDDAIKIVSRVFIPFCGESMEDAQDRLLVYGRLLDTDGKTLDICLCTVSHAPKSYTGENTAELQCHGSPAMLQRALLSLFAAGARQALAGEFTKRAFLNGKMDLTQAEAVIDLIHADTALAAKNAAGQLGGAILRKADTVYSSLTDISAHYHAVLDYPDEDIEDFSLKNYESEISKAISSLKHLYNTYERGSVMNSGVPTAIIGRPNAGKSSLLNALLGYDRAIVTDIPGTTRDTIEERVSIGGVLLRLIDTAGLREAGDEVERLGVMRSRQAAEKAQLVIAVIDSSSDISDEDKEIIDLAKSAPKSIIVLSKSDLPDASQTIADAVLLSSVTLDGLADLESTIQALFPADYSVPTGEILTNSRQADAILRAIEALEGAFGAMKSGVTADAVLTSCEDAMSALGELTGKTIREDITARIFERFCVGK